MPKHGPRWAAIGPPTTERSDNHVLGQDPAYLAAYQALVAEIQAQDAGLMIIEAWRRNWPEPNGHGYSTWYEHSTTRGGSGPRWPGCWRIRR